MQSTEWILLDTETTGFKAPIFVVEIAAQKMKGWNKVGPPFRYLVNQNEDIPPEASRVHGYTREILERDGEPPELVYTEFSKYVRDLPIVAYNLAYDLDKVLLPEWKRLGISPIGTTGFCALHLAQRLLDPVPAGNCKLQTLRQYYHLPERGAHTGMGDVETVIDLLQTILKPLAEERNISSWDELIKFSGGTWFPSKIPFGKHKGRDFRDASKDGDLRSWLEWLSQSSNAKSSQMGHWYLEKLSSTPPKVTNASSSLDFDATSSGTNLVGFIDQDSEKLKELIAFGRARLAEVSAEYMAEKRSVDSITAALFNILKDLYKKRDNLVLLIKFRKRFIDVLLAEGEEEAEKLNEEFEEEQETSDSEYDEASKNSKDTQDLTKEEQEETKTLFKELAKLHHPDLYANDPKLQTIYKSLTSAINVARDEGNISVLREIAHDHQGYILKQGWGDIHINTEDIGQNLSKIYDAIQIEIVDLLENLNTLRESAQYEVMVFCKDNPERLQEVAKRQAAEIEIDIEELTVEADRLHDEIIELTGNKDVFK